MEREDGGPRGERERGREGKGSSTFVLFSGDLGPVGEVARLI